MSLQIETFSAYSIITKDLSSELRASVINALMLFIATGLFWHFLNYEWLYFSIPTCIYVATMAIPFMKWKKFGPKQCICRIEKDHITNVDQQRIEKKDIKHIEFVRKQTKEGKPLFDIMILLNSTDRIALLMDIETSIMYKLNTILNTSIQVDRTFHKDIIKNNKNYTPLKLEDIL